jgi:hypothetical protein
MGLPFKGDEDLKAIVTHMDIGFPHAPFVMNLLQHNRDVYAH